MADNPFNALLDPSKRGSITGFIGGLLGNPTASQAAGSATGAALKNLSDLRAQGETPQGAMLKFLQTPQGQDYFTQAGPDGMKSLVEGLQATVPPAPTLQNAPAGSQTYSTDPLTGKTTQIGSNPTTEQQNFKAWVDISRMPAARVRELADLHADPTAKHPDSDAKVAVDNLIKNYNLDPAVGQGILAGTIKVLPIKDQYNADTGRVSVVDITRGTINEISPGKSTASPATPTPSTSSPYPPLPTPGVTPDKGAGTGVLPPAKTDPTAGNPYFSKKSDMFLGSGILPNTVGGLSTYGEQVDPTLISKEGAKANDRKVMINTLRNDLNAMSTLGEGLSVNKGTIQSYLELVPTGGNRESPHEAVQKGIRLLQHIEQEVAAEEAKTVNPNLPREERTASAKKAEAWKKVQRDMPTMDEMSALEKSIRSGTAGALTPTSAAKEVLDYGSKVLQSGKKQTQQVGQETGVTSGPASTNAQERAFDNASEAQLLQINPRDLSVPELVKYRNRIQQLKAARGKK